MSHPGRIIFRSPESDKGHSEISLVIPDHLGQEDLNERLNKIRDLQDQIQAIIDG